MADVSNMEDVMDVRDIIERVEEIEPDLWTNHYRHCDEEWSDTADSTCNDKCPTCGAEIEPHKSEESDDYDEHTSLMAFLDEMKGNGGDHQWRGDWYPVTVVRESYFKDYAQELAEEQDLIKADAHWPNNCIDWDQAARELKIDYTGADFGDITYYFR